MPTQVDALVLGEGVEPSADEPSTGLQPAVMHHLHSPNVEAVSFVAVLGS